MVADNIASMRIGDNQHASIEATSQTEAAEELNVSRSAVQRAHKVNTEGSEELIEAVHDGEVSVSAASTIATLPKEEQAEIVEEIDAGAKPAEVIKAHVAHNSGEHEWYTPAVFIEAARAAMGSIDLDPASSRVANETVQAGSRQQGLQGSQIASKVRFSEVYMRFAWA